MAKRKLTKGACMTDIHFGKKSNSPVHNDDCLRFITWFCQQVQEHECDHVCFLGDWNENRSALNIATLNSSYLGAKMLNELGVPVFFCVGNHDLYHRHTREIYSVVPFQEFNNFTIVDQPIVIPHVGSGTLFSPFLFHEEYAEMDQFLKLDAWFGHFEFKGFLVTGYNVLMPTGPDPESFRGPKHIMSGHFHKRQHSKSSNIIYMGNVFPMDFGDAGDNDRGMMIYDHITQTPTFINWVDCPKYAKVKLTDIIDGSIQLPSNARVKCVVDIPINFEESSLIRQDCVGKYDLREFVLEESRDIMAAINNTETTVDGTVTELDSVDDLVVQMLSDINSEHISNELLIEQYRGLRD